MQSGIINVYKEAGYTSFDVVAKLRGILGIKKIGHTGTLDPDAVGVLPVCIGKATKVCDLLTDKDKTYRCVMRLGIVTDTQDMSGKILKQNLVQVEPEYVKEVLYSFVGESTQIPPMYSALKVNGQKLCDLARQGIEVERKPRKIYISDMVIQDIQLPRVSFQVTCSKGTYIRTLCQDVGDKLGCGACMESLERSRVSVFSIEESLKLNEIEQFVKDGKIQEKILSVSKLFADYPVVYGKKDSEKKLRNGNSLLKEEVTGEWKEVPQGTCVRMFLQNGIFVGIFIWDGQKFKPKKMFLE